MTMTNEEMIEKLESDGLSSISDMDFITDALEENTKLKAENERLKENYETLSKQYCNVENSSIAYYNEMKKLKAELEQSKIKKTCDNCKYFILAFDEGPCNSCEDECNWVELKGKVE